MTAYDRKAVFGPFRRFCPGFRAKTLADIVPKTLFEEGVRAVLLDVDNTLVNWKAMHIPEETHEWLEACKRVGLKICLVSNTRNPSRLHILSERLNVPYVCGKMKPSRQPFQEALNTLGVHATEAVMIGDQIFTDVWGGNRAGVMTIWLDPRHSREFIGTKISRLAERAISRFIEKARSA